MKIRPRADSVLIIVYRVLLGIFLCLALFFLAGTIYSFFLRNRTSRPLSESVFSDTADPRIFTGIGRLRLPAGSSLTLDNPASAGVDSTTDIDAATVVISISFPYLPEDLAFSEELATRVNDFRAIVREYFAGFSAEDVRLMDEEYIKQELLQRFNSVLRLGRIEVLYFNDFMLIE